MERWRKVSRKSNGNFVRVPSTRTSTIKQKLKFKLKVSKYMSCLLSYFPVLLGTKGDLPSFKSLHDMSANHFEC